MTKDEIQRRVVKALPFCSCEPSAVKRESYLVDDLGFDSLDEVEFIMAIEEEFRTELGGNPNGGEPFAEIPDTDAQKLTTVGAVVDYIAAKAGVTE